MSVESKGNHKHIIKMEFVELVKALLYARDIKIALALVGAYFLEIVGPALEFMVFGTLVLVFEVLTGIFANLKERSPATSNAAQVVFKITLYPISIFMMALVEKQWVPLIPLTHIASGYIVIHEFEQAMANVSVLTGWKVRGIVALAKIHIYKIKKKIPK